MDVTVSAIHRDYTSQLRYGVATDWLEPEGSARVTALQAQPAGRTHADLFDAQTRERMRAGEPARRGTTQRPLGSAGGAPHSAAAAGGAERTPGGPPPPPPGAGRPRAHAVVPPTFRDAGVERQGGTKKIFR
jgi:hypothetical protein